MIKIALWRGFESVSAVEDKLRQLFERSEFWRNPEQAYRLLALELRNRIKYNKLY